MWNDQARPLRSTNVEDEVHVASASPDLGAGLPAYIGEIPFEPVLPAPPCGGSVVTLSIIMRIRIPMNHAVFYVLPPKVR